MNEQIPQLTKNLPIGTRLRCRIVHEDGDFTAGRIYKVNAYRCRNVAGKVEYFGVRIRDNKRQRKDFNFIPTSKNYIWNYFVRID